jgi:DNA-binding XRE family transcriptional regulator
MRAALLASSAPGAGRHPAPGWAGSARCRAGLGVAPRPERKYLLAGRTIGQWVRGQRQDWGWTQEELGALVGYSVHMIRKIEADRTQPSSEGFAQFVAVFTRGVADYVAYGCPPHARGFYGSAFHPPTA